MKKYIKLIIPNAIVVTLILLSFLYLRINANKIGLGGVAAAMELIGLFGIYLIVYGIVSFKKTKSVIYPNLILLVFIVVFWIFSYIILITQISFTLLLEMAVIIVISLSFSLIPSIITKGIMLIADKCGKKKSQKQDGQQQA